MPSASSTVLSIENPIAFAAFPSVVDIGTDIASATWLHRLQIMKVGLCPSPECVQAMKAFSRSIL